MLHFAPNPAWVGQSLTPLLRGEPLRERFLFAELLRRPEHPRPAMRSVVSAQWKLIETSPRDGETRSELYDLKNDPAERRDAASTQAGTLARLRQELQTLAGQTHDYSNQEVKVKMNGETVEQLKTLGYVE